MSKQVYKFGDIFSAVRKEAGLTQYDLCKHLAISQSNLSKIESNQLRPAADLWIDFCERFSLPVDSFRSGYIDSLVRKNSFEGNKKRLFVDIPHIYNENAFLRVRFLIPIFEDIKMLFGVEKFHEVITAMNVDPHILNVRDTVVNFKFLSDFLNGFEFNSENYNFIKAAEMANHDFVHGKIWGTIAGKNLGRSTSQITKKIDSYIKGYYLRHELYTNSQIKLVLPPFPSRPSFLKDISLVEKINYVYLPNYLKSLVNDGSQVQFMDEGPSFQIFIKSY